MGPHTVQAPLLHAVEVERQEAVARANQDREVANEEALQLGQKQMYVLDQRKAVEEREIQNELALERMRTDREVAVTEEARNARRPRSRRRWRWSVRSARRRSR